MPVVIETIEKATANSANRRSTRGRRVVFTVSSTSDLLKIGPECGAAHSESTVWDS